MDKFIWMMQYLYQQTIAHWIVLFGAICTLSYIIIRNNKQWLKSF
mgnify:CR=1 FL=1